MHLFNFHNVKTRSLRSHSNFRYLNSLVNYLNILGINLFSHNMSGNPTKRLKRKWCRDLL